MRKIKTCKYNNEYQINKAQFIQKTILAVVARFMVHKNAK